MPDYIHLLLSIPLNYSVSCFMRYLKGKSAIMKFECHANLKINSSGRQSICEYGKGSKKETRENIHEQENRIR